MLVCGVFRDTLALIQVQASEPFESLPDTHELAAVLFHTCYVHTTISWTVLMALLVGEITLFPQQRYTAVSMLGIFHLIKQFTTMQC